MLDFRIDTFLCVCRHLNFTKASKELNITQPAVSQHIHHLENEYGTKLFTQDGKKLFLTDNGKLLYKKMNQIKNDDESLKEILSKNNHGLKDISFGVTMTIGEYIIADPISDYIKNHPDTNLMITFGNTSELLKKLSDGVIDFALVEGYFPENDYETLLFSKEEFVPVCSAKHSFNQKPRVIKDLFPERILIREPGSGTRNILERALALNNYSTSDFRNFTQVENMHAIISLIEKDCGITFLYKAAVASGLQSGYLKTIPLDDFRVKHDFTFIWPKDTVFSEEIRAICEEIQPITHSA
ncbi:MULTISPECIES: LysR family transcriptional regulator [unclassified Butyrivibrio]|uniref:LysR family transcriptional regulator n=2 Tax=Butyrivibrio TaxID=830 RepID=UPI0004276510|nr:MULTISPECIES: LysR family transcriptional regulator [unclassified Butyrivibrio]